MLFKGNCLVDKNEAVVGRGSILIVKIRKTLLRMMEQEHRRNLSP
jgi:hypothetical protein